MKLNKLKNNKGFTIIEVMIVLAIAGLIMVIVFLAVPALQRSSRNTQRKSEAANLMSAINEWAGNKQGKLPSSDANFTEVKNNVKFNIYDPTKITLEAAGTSAVAVNTGAEAINTVRYVAAAKCNTDLSGSAVRSSVSTRAFVLLYNVEGGGGDSGTPVCVES
jgi:prepilin-type N-terminal cleavage/methylation domain-containing protein